MDQIHLDPQDNLTPHPLDRIGQRDPPPLGHIFNKTPSPPPQDKKVPAAHPLLKIIFGRALRASTDLLKKYKHAACLGIC